jgi:NTE family protein
VIFDRSARLEKEMASAESYEEWANAAKHYDYYNRLDEWKEREESAKYDYVAIRDRLEQLRALRRKSDSHGLLFTLNEGIHGNMSGMGRHSLYEEAMFGTKQLIVDYVDEIVSALKYLSSGRVRKIHIDEKIEFFNRASHCFGHTAFLMSGAGSLLYFHLGVVKALWEQRLLPRVVSGSSGGALVAALIGTHTDEELDKMFDPTFLGMEIEKEAGIWRLPLIGGSNRVSSDEVTDVICRLIPDLTFEEAEERTGYQVNISVAPAETHQTSRLLNSTTSPNVMIREAVLASCAVPGFYPPVSLAAKDENGNRKAYLPARKWVDGSVAEDLPIKRLSRLYGVNHTIVSQTNPIVLPFVNAKKQQQSAWDILQNAGLTTWKEWTLAVARLAQKPARHSELASRWLDTFTSVVKQTYTGDITILPSSRAHNPVRALSFRETEEAMDLIRDGERATWPKVEMIRTQTKIGRTLEDIIERLEDSVVANAQAHESEVLKLVSG